MHPKILVVDDDVNMLELLNGSLTDAGYLVQTTESGEAGLELALTFSPDLILLDLMLPKINGFNVCEKLRSHHATAITPIIMMTTLPGRFPRLEGIMSGCDDYISKPFEVRDLLLCIGKWLHRPEHTELIKRQSNAG